MAPRVCVLMAIDGMLGVALGKVMGEGKNPRSVGGWINSREEKTPRRKGAALGSLVKQAYRTRPLPAAAA